MRQNLWFNEIGSWLHANPNLWRSLNNVLDSLPSIAINIEMTSTNYTAHHTQCRWWTWRRRWRRSCCAASTWNPSCVFFVIGQWLELFLRVKLMLKTAVHSMHGNSSWLDSALLTHNHCRMICSHSSLEHYRDFFSLAKKKIIFVRTTTHLPGKINQCDTTIFK